MSANHQHQLVIQQGSQHHIGPQLNYKEQPALTQIPQMPSNNFLQNPTGWQQQKHVPLDYRISNNYTHSQDSRINISTDIISNDQSRIRPGAVLKLRSDSPANDRSQISNQVKLDTSNQLVITE